MTERITGHLNKVQCLADKGFAFIRPPIYGRDVFVHISAIKKSGIDPSTLQNGDVMSAEIEFDHDDRGRAVNVRVERAATTTGEGYDPNYFVDRSEKKEMNR